MTEGYTVRSLRLRTRKPAKAVVTVLFLALLSLVAAPPTASASTGYYATSETLAEASARLSREITEDGGSVDAFLAHYSGELPDTAGDDVKNAFVRILSTDSAVQDLYESLEGETLVSRLKLDADEPLDSWLAREGLEAEIDDRTDMLVNSIEVLPVDGDVAGETGGQLADIASDATPLAEKVGIGWTAAAPIGLLTVALGELVYDDLKTGTNPVLTLLGIDTHPDAEDEEDAQAEEPDLPPIESPRWVFLPRVTNAELGAAHYAETMKGVWEYVNAHRSRWDLPESWHSAPNESDTFDEGAVGNPERSVYVLTIGVGGYEHNFSAPAEGATAPPEPVGPLSRTSFGYESIEDQCFGHILPENRFVTFDADGPREWPDERLPNVDFVYGQGVHEWAICTEYGRYGEYYGYNSLYAGARFQVATVRTPAQMRLELPHKVSSAELPAGTVETEIAQYEGDAGLTSSIHGLAAALEGSEDSVGQELLEHAESGEKLPGEAAVPNCRGLSVSACESELADAGFTGSPVIEELTWKAADLELEPEHVVDTSPGSGSDADKSSGIKLVIDPNPTNMRKLAETLITQNASAELSTEESEAAAEQCLHDTMSTGESEVTGASECETLPIFSSGSDVAEATEHDVKALTLYPGWVKLNWERSTVKEELGESRGWYKGSEGCPGSSPPEGESCDEYPFFATEQGGPGGDPTPSLEYVDRTDNSNQGSRYSGFLSACKIEEGGAFLAVPLPPRLGIPTTRLCNNTK
jgi:hypothetical protein